MRRREFITLVGGAAAAWPLSAQAQQPMPVIGFLSGRSLASDAHLVKAFRDGLGDGGYVEGRNIVVEFRWAEGKSEQLTALATNLVAHRVDVVFAGGIDVGIGIRELRTTLANVPIVYAIGGDPVAFGLAASLGRPGGNATGMTVITATLWPKRLEILRELVGHIDTVAVLIDPANATAALAAKDIKAAARDVGQRIILVNAYAQTEFDAVFATIARERAGALLVSDDPVFINGAISLLLSRHSMQSLPSMAGASFPPMGDWRAMERVWPTNIVSAGAMSVVFWREPTQRTCRSCSRPDSSW